MSHAPAPRAFHVMSKPTGAVCNLDCEYCFFLSKEQLYPDSGFRMTPEVHEAFLQQLFAAHPADAEVIVAYQGGEPTLMGLEFFARSVELAARYAGPHQSVLHTIQTNGTLLDDEWGAFLAEHGFLVGLSIDGPRAMHDAYRVDKGGKPTFDRVLHGWEVLRRHGVEWNALTTVNAANADHGLEVYRFLRDDLGAEFIQFIPIVERMTPEMLPMADSGWGVRAKDRPLYRQAGDAVTHRSVTGEQYGRFLIDVFEEWARHDVGDVFVQMFDTALAHWLGMDQAGLCVHAKTCGSALALEHNGDLYSCDHYVEPDYLLGNIAEGRTMLDLVDLPGATGVRQRQARHPPAVLPGLRRAVRVQRRLPEGPLRHHPRRRSRPALPVRRIQGVLQPRRCADAVHGRPAARRPGRHCPARLVRRRRRPARAQRPVHMRLGPEVQELPRCTDRRGQSRLIDESAGLVSCRDLRLPASPGAVRPRDGSCRQPVQEDRQEDGDRDRAEDGRGRSLLR